MRILKRSGLFEVVRLDKITERVQRQIDLLNINSEVLDAVKVSMHVCSSIKDGITTSELDEMTAQICMNWTLDHPDWGILGSRIIIDNHRKNVQMTFCDAMKKLYEHKDIHGIHSPLISEDLYEIINAHWEEINSIIDPERDYLIDYFGFKTLEKSYLLKTNGKIVETPQYMWMRVSLGIWEDDFVKVKNTYDLMSQKYFTHATPTLFNSGTPRPQNISCFLLGTEDSLEGIYKTITDCAKISKWAGGIGVHISNIRGDKSYIRKTGGKADGILPMLKVYNETARYINQSGKRLGSFAMYLEPWHSDVFAFLDAKSNHGNDMERARDLFYALWIPDLFMKRVQDNGVWSLMCPDECPGLDDVYGKDFESLYEEYEEELKFREQIPARKLWSKILISQMETGMPYMLYKDSVNKKSNQSNKGVVKSSNLCSEITEYSDADNTACCNLASINLQAFVKPRLLPKSISVYGKTNCPSCKIVKNILKEQNVEYEYVDLDDDELRQAFYKSYNVNTVPQVFVGNTRIGGFEKFVEFIRPDFDVVLLRHVVHTAIENLDRIIDLNYYPIPEAEDSNSELRPIGLGVQGLADMFAKMYIPFTSQEAKDLNKLIFELIQMFSVEKSIELAKDHDGGCYDLFEGSPVSQGLFQHNLWNISDGKDPFENEREEWKELRKAVQIHGIRNSLLTALMPTASTGQILGSNASMEPFTTNMYVRRTLAGEFIVINPYMLKMLHQMGLYDNDMKYTIMHFRGDIESISRIPSFVKDLFKTSWKMKVKDLIDMSADRGRFVDQSQSFNLFVEEPDESLLTKIHFYGWKKGLKTGQYYLHTKPATTSQTFTIDPDLERKIINENSGIGEEQECLMCSS